MHSHDEFCVLHHPVLTSTLLIPEVNGITDYWRHAANQLAITHIQKLK
jgi:hypothetical protein